MRWLDTFEMIWLLSVGFLLVILGVNLLPSIVQTQDKLVEYAVIFCIIMMGFTWVIVFARLIKEDKKGSNNEVCGKDKHGK